MPTSYVLTDEEGNGVRDTFVNVGEVSLTPFSRFPVFRPRFHGPRFHELMIVW